MTKSLAASRKTSFSESTGAGINANTKRTSWMANNAMPDSIIMKTICRTLLPRVEPKLRSVEVGSTMSLRILNTIMPVINVFTAMDAAKPVVNVVFGQKLTSLLFVLSPLKADASQVAVGNKLKSAYRMKIDWLT